MKLYGFDRSRSHRVLWALEELAVPYEYKSLNFAKGEHKSSKFLAKNPAGKVPVLEDGDFMLTESTAIVTYLADKYCEKNFVPKAGSLARAHYNRWMAFTISELEQPLWAMGKHKFIYPEEKRIPQMLELALWEFANQLKVLEQGLGDNPYILGENFTMADILLGHTLFWARTFKVPIGIDCLEKYADRLIEREAFQRANAQYEK